ncbi:MAG TPA: TetR/AcrR family transcriptional regulator [Roseiflexaceae bacterium]|nr:TetR/AcrR family transcriptional regulator [Roseiflexaceae bacterium]
MPKGFSERERTIIRAKLRERGGELFGTYGLRKTNIDELARVAGISKGAFYLFYESKEELFFELLEQFEAKYQAAMLKQIVEDPAPPRERMKALLTKALSVRQDNGLFARLSQEEYQYLFRKLPEERLQAHMRGDAEFAVEFVAAWRQAGVEIACEPEMVSSLIRALFLMSVHEDDIGAEMYARVIETYTELLANYLVPS